MGYGVQDAEAAIQQLMELAMNGQQRVPAPMQPERTAIALDPATMPPASKSVADLLKAGIRSTRYLFPENGPVKTIEVWEPPVVPDEATLGELARRLQNLRLAFEPAAPGELLSRVLVLLAHYRAAEHSKAVETGLAMDWADDLADYPMWAVEDAARTWRRTKKFRPQICEMIELCDAACGKLRIEWDRLESIANASEAARNPMSDKVRSLALSLIKPVPGSRPAGAAREGNAIR